MKLAKGKLPLSLMAIIISAVAFTGVIFTEDLRSLTEEKQNTAKKDEFIDEDKNAFNPSNCKMMDGKWVFNSSMEPLYTDKTCPYIERQIACQTNGRKDGDYRHWEWQLDDCTLPRFNPRLVLEKLRGKRLMFVGDSLQRGQWLSFVCMLQSIIPEDKKYMNRTRSLSVFGAKEFNATVEFYWSPFLIESNSDDPIITDTTKRILHVDCITKHARNWVGVDFLVFNTYVWWMSGHRLKTLWGSFSNGDEGYEELDAAFAYRLGLKTWANWVDSNIDPTLTRVFFTTMSPTHMRSSDWHNKKGIRCYNETKPVMERGHWGSGSDKQMMEVVSSIVERMIVPVTFINITQLSEYRIDGHVSVYTETGGEMLTKKQKANPRRYADCIHWCLPGVPDTWNQVLYAYL
ncbi:hypothetical protein J5N97_013753 [Dioscorea zingiberensis]|uniref:Trichome birefringence-like N-terminal domain-containing protein n=1 Tax=Dioscorea zingiberensis TaxID=325984 RepID=A0A9D5CSK2_9LILI|nr:hypothetical protein J5N97_013743 [Dioscorea zingiberensis]KAJ0978279.1 hypothetical protein J5N97_013753 [Dioscorea zingiberensis]